MFKSLALFALFTAASARKCTNITVPVSLNAENAVFNLETPLTKIQVTNFILNLTRQGQVFPQEAMKGMAEISGHYELGATYCEPDGGPGHELQIMTHGIGFDRSYWDQPYNGYNYSYVAKAVDQHGYSTLTWDRLGIGASSKGDALNEIQVSLEIAALHELTTQARQGSLPCVTAKYSKTVHIGHSFGSVMTYALANMWPDLSDAVVLTGFAHVNAYLPLFAVSNNFIPITDSPLAAQYPAGYMATASTVSVHINFFAEGDFDPQLLELAYQTGQPVTPGELLTIGGPAMENSSYTGPVLIVTGEHDVPFCGGDCYSTDSISKELPSLLDVSKSFFTKASRFNTTVVPGAGHGLNFGYSHSVAYDAILDFLAE
ncbi:hypothetical protein FZEAL_9458 [Fusarium zealandicum]|uniref:AB hydrolase-1 domain-containing protein n=1 Tax=Fusarium zealandicum TaxID=1053134 RepID=A0A8H4UAP5_9HYPO|nr:hypothetical protein FZEAL_9458 [Fusarium zealandicum]